MSIDNKPPKSESAKKLDQELEAKNKDIQEDIIEALKNGITTIELVSLGYDDKEIANAQNTKELQEQSNSNNPDKDREEKMDAVVEQIMSRIASRNARIENLNTLANNIEANEKKLAGLMELREQLVLKESEVKILSREELDKAKVPDGGLVLIKESDGNLENATEKIVVKKEASAGIKEEGIQAQKELDKLWFFQVGAIRKKKKEIKLLKQKYDELKKEEEILEKIKEDKEKKPFMYFTAEKITNPELRQLLENQQTHTLDFRYIESEDKYNRQYKSLKWLNENEGFFDFNTLGFIRVIKNVKEIRGEKGIQLYSDEALYKIVGPDGTIVADNIKGYREAKEIYDEATNKYKEAVEQEFNKLKNK